MAQSDTDNIFPHFFIGGSQKCGTSSLAIWLDQHPSLVCSSPKEPNFFSNHMLKELKNDFSSYYQKKLNGIPFEATTSTMVDHVALERIKNTLGTNIKFIFIVKDPVKRAVSAYCHLLKHFAEKRSLEEVFGSLPTHAEDTLQHETNLIDQALSTNKISVTRYRLKYDNGIWPYRYLYNSLYSLHIKRFQDAFGSENIHVLHLESLKQNPKNSLDRICAFLNIPDFEDVPNTQKAYNKTRVPSYLLNSHIRNSDHLTSICRSIHHLVGRGPVSKLFYSAPPKLPEDLEEKLTTFFSNEYQFLKTVT